jgi:type I restriction enzyme S subunit
VSYEFRPLGEVCKTTSGGTPSRSKPHYFNGPIPWVKSGELPDGMVVENSEYISEEAISNSSAKLLPAGTLLVALYGATVGKLGILSRPAATNQAVCAIFPRDVVNTKFLFWYLLAKRPWLIGQAVGGAQPNISQGVVRSLPVPVMSLMAQQGIVAEIEKQFSRLDDAVANLQRVKANLKRYKAFILKAAVEGRLVETEASLARREGRTCETGEQLLQRILEARRVNSKGSSMLGVAPPLGEMPSIPEGWVWTSLGQCFRVAVGATPSRKEATYWNGDVPWVSSGEVKLGRIRHTEEHISAAGLANSSTRINPAGSVMIGMIGQGRTRGQAAILDIDAANNQNCAAIWVSHTDVPPEFVFNWLLSRYTETRSEGSGNNQQALNKRLVEQIPLPLPPLAEQVRIVVEVDRHLSIIREVEAEVDANHQRAQALRQSILQRSFATGRHD